MLLSAVFCCLSRLVDNRHVDAEIGVHTAVSTPKVDIVDSITSTLLRPYSLVVIVVLLVLGAASTPQRPKSVSER